MKKNILLVVAMFATMPLLTQNIRVLSDQKIGEGWYPRISADGMSVDYLEAEDATYAITEDRTTYVTTENLQLVLYKNGKRTILTPHGSDVHYIWPSLSPDGNKILFNTKRGTAVCDLQGKELVNLGDLDAPQWFGNDYIVGMFDPHDGHRFLGSSIFIRSIDGTYSKCLSKPEEFGMYPTVSVETGRIAYNTLGGELRLMQLNMSDKPIMKQIPVCRKAQAAPRREIRKVKKLKDLSQLKIYINPGHGGHGSNDRNMVIYPFTAGDPEGFWESNSNLDKGLMLDTMLRSFGIQTMMSRTTNNDGGGNDSDVLAAWLRAGTITQEQYQDMLKNGDDRSLSAIVAEANAYGADFMLSIHSNAGVNNYVLELYSGKDLNDNGSYGSVTRHDQEGYDICTIMAEHLYNNKITNWGSNYSVRGDKTFAKQIFGWSDGYGVLRGLQMAGCISEGAMHDYTPETYRLMNIDYKKQEAWNFARTFLEYYCEEKIPTGVIGGQVRDAYQQQIFPDIYHIRGSRDELEPLCGATVELIKNDAVIKTYTTDTLYNGVFFFWDLEPAVYKVRVKADKYYDLTQELEVVANDITYADFMMNLQRSTPPEIISYSPMVAAGDSVEVTTPVLLNFNWDMMVEPTAAAFSITPAVDGTISFENSNKTLRFAPATAYEPDMEYTVTLSTEACHPDTLFENHLREPFVLSFVTKNRPHLMLKQNYPEDGATGISLTPTFKLLFDAELDEDMSTKYFKVTGPDGFSYSPTLRSMEYNDVAAPYGSVTFAIPAGSELKEQTEYQLVLDSKVADASGVELGEQHIIGFTTGTASYSTEGELIISCDGTDFQMNQEKSRDVKQKMIIIDKATKTEGTCSNRVEYAFGDDKEAELFLTPTDPSNIFTSEDVMFIDLFGDLSYNDIMIEFSTEGDVHLLELTSMDYAGWQTFRLDLSALPIAVEYQFTGLKVVNTGNILSGRGTFYIDNIRRLKGAATGVGELNGSDIRKVNKLIYEGNMLIDTQDGIYNAAGKKIR